MQIPTGGWVDLFGTDSEASFASDLDAPPTGAQMDVDSETDELEGSVSDDYF